MSKKKVFLFSYFIIMLFTFVSTVSAVSNFTVSVKGDMVTLSAKYVSKFQYSVNGGALKDICVGLSNNKNVNTCSISVKNGTYKFHASGSSVYDGVQSKSIEKTITTSCSDQSKTGKTDSGTVERCFLVDANGNYKMATDSTVISCASGYKLSYSIAKNGNGCTGLSVQSGKLRYCKAVFSYSCTKGGENQSRGLLTALSADGYTLSPAFTTYTFVYTVNVPASASSVTVNATAASGHTFEDGYGPRTVTLGSGTTSVVLNVKGPGGVNPYTIHFVKKSSSSPIVNPGPGPSVDPTPVVKDTDTSLKRITVDKGTLTPSFSPDTFVYNVEVAGDIDKIGIGADLNSSKASFLEGYGPRTVNLYPGYNAITIKVKSESGDFGIYTVNINRNGGGVCELTPEQLPYLKEILIGDQVEDDMDEDELEDLRPAVSVPDFNPEEFSYTFDIPYEYEDLPVDAYVATEGDTVKVEGNKNLEVNEKAVITISVTDKDCPDTIYEYKLNVTRLPKEVLSSEIVVEDIRIQSKKDKKHYYDINFEQSKKNYYITVNKGEKGLSFNVETGENGESYKVYEPDKFGKGASYTIKVTSADGSEEVEYIIKVSKVKSGASSFFLIILILIIVLILIYVVLRLMGYRIYFNPAMLGAMFRGNGKDKFDK